MKGNEGIHPLAIIFTLYSSLSFGLGHKSMTCSIGGCPMGAFSVQEQFSTWDLTFHEEGQDELHALNDAFQNLGVIEQNESIMEAYISIPKKQCEEARDKLGPFYCKSGAERAYLTIQTDRKYDEKVHHSLYRIKYVDIPLSLELHPKLNEGMDHRWDLYLTYDKKGAKVDLLVRDCTYSQN